MTCTIEHLTQCNPIDVFMPLSALILALAMMIYVLVEIKKP